MALNVREILAHTEGSSVGFIAAMRVSSACAFG